MRLYALRTAKELYHFPDSCVKACPDRIRQRTHAQPRGFAVRTDPSAWMSGRAVIRLESLTSYASPDLIVIQIDPKLDRAP